MSFTISQNTLLKILVRRGSNQERQNITLSEGEVGYTVDSKRLFIGDGSTAGGTVAGNKFYGLSDSSSAPTYKTSLASFGTYGDFIYDTNDSLFYVITGANGLANSNFAPFGGANIVRVDNVKVAKSANGTLTLLPLSGSALAANSLRGGLSAVGDTLQLGPVIYANTIAASSFAMPGVTTIGSTQFNIPAALSTPGMLYWASGTVTTRPVPNNFVFIEPVNIMYNLLGQDSLPISKGLSSYTVTVATSTAAVSGFPDGIASVYIAGKYNLGSDRILMYIQSDRSNSVSNPITFDVISSSANADCFNMIIPLSGIANNTSRTFTFTVSTNATSGNFYLSAIGAGY